MNFAGGGGVYFKAFGCSCYSDSPFLPAKRGQPGEDGKIRGENRT
jgi:hypothetical protein